MRRKILLVLGAAVIACIAWVGVWTDQGGSLQSVKLGTDVCGRCGMVISDIHYEISVLDQDRQHHTITRHFDDVGCFLNFARAAGKRQWTGIAHDYRTGQEVPLEKAFFANLGVSSPMGSGWVAVARASELKSPLSLDDAIIQGKLARH